jgi:hypothetical protein
VYSSALAEAPLALPNAQQLDPTGPCRPQSKKFDRPLRSKESKTDAKRNALPLAGAYHAALTAALHASHAGAELDFALDFFA